MQTDADLKPDVSGSSFDVGNSMIESSCDRKTLESERKCKNVFDREATIILLKKEIESAFESLKEVKAEIAKLRGEKHEILLSEKQSRQSMKHLIDQISALQASMVIFEEQSGLKMVNFSNKLVTVEQILHETCASWCQTKEVVHYTFQFDISQIFSYGICSVYSFIISFHTKN